ncbi:MOSC domain-containing protein [Pseudaminobacter sp. 19-2017]|uniref:MOSC domain-containing protein n=1 Tax=Pseudaminobacter soli (ex Zhang et al. 2022) TaxID=2831468 RepID=A0A942DVZ0_9HYPH|nr:MOSC domain-containing protein [Pseudaminobacter soli]MBS3647893.1 MOSC domain-containing protein [Pseudaminobacter soli]
MTAPHRVTELWRYPVSSFGGERQDEIWVDPQGVVGDRLFGIVDAGSDEVARPYGVPKWEGVSSIKARLTAAGLLQIAVPGGAWVSAPGAEADAVISDFLGLAAAVRPFGADESGKTLSPRYEKAPIHLLTTASLDRLKQLHPTGVADPRRFRPNIVVGLPAVEGSFPETEWIGRRLTIGDLELTVSEPCRRCGFTIIAQDGFEKDPEILRTLVRHNSHNMGVYCTVDRPGRVFVGDELLII